MAPEVKTPHSSPGRAAIVAEARSWIGTPYRHQGSLKGEAADCLGFVRGVWRAFYGAEPEPMPAYSPDWAEGGRRETLFEAASRHLRELDSAAAGPGDVLLFRWRVRLPMKHCAILVEPGRIVHAYDAAGAVVETALAFHWHKMVAAAFAFPGVDAGSPKRLAEPERGVFG